MNYKKQIGKAVFVMLGFYNLHNLSYLMVGSWNVLVSVFLLVLFMAMTAILHRIIELYTKAVKEILNDSSDTKKDSNYADWKETVEKTELPTPFHKGA